MNYRELCKRLEKVYPSEGWSEATAIVRLVLEIRFGMTYTDIVCGKVSELSEDEQLSLEEIMQRLEKGEPVQYVLGEADFDGHTFHVEPGVLIPRPETAELIPHLKVAGDQPYRVLDIGTGSGCIAISTALDFTNAEVEAWDISEDALRIAKGNAELLGAKVKFEQHDILEVAEILSVNRNLSANPDSTIEPKTFCLEPEVFDIIVSNPPYIAEKEAKDMSRNVLDYEPSIALFVPDDDPLRFYRAIAKVGKYALKPEGQLYFEINPLYAEEMKAMLEEEGYKDTELLEDQFGKQRFTKSIRS